MANIEKITYKGDVYDISDAKAMHQDDIGPWMPDFDNMPVLETHEFDISGTSIYKVCERANVTSINDATDVIAYRCTVTGTNIRSVTDVIFRLTPTVNTAPNVTAYNRTLSTTAATTGLRYIYTVYPKADNTNYTYQSCVAMYNSTTRHVKIEVFKTNSNWTFVNARTSYSYNSTYQTRNELSIYTRLGYISNSTAYFNANTANSATYISSFAPLYNSSYSLLTAGAALSANTIAFVSSEDNKVYPISNTTKAINTNWPLMWVSNAVSSGGAISYSYLRVFGTITPGSTVTKDTFSAGQTVYCRCTITNGNVYSNNFLTPTITPGYAYVKFGIAYSATVVVENTYGAFYFYKDMNGNVSNLNGYPIGAERANSVAKNINASTGSYGVLIDDHDISTLNSTVVPSISNNLTFNPSTGILNATGFSGSGAGLTNIPSSAVSGLPTNLSDLGDDMGVGMMRASDNVLFGTCSSAATAATKVITITNSSYEVKAGTRILVWFSNVSGMPTSGNLVLSIDDVTYRVYIYEPDGGSAVSYLSRVAPYFRSKRFLNFYISGDNPQRAYILPDTDTYLKSPQQKEIRIATMNVQTSGGAYMQMYCATNACTTGKPSINGAETDATVIHLNWDNSDKYSNQIAVQSGNDTLHGMAYRNQNGSSGGWNPWKTLIDEDNISSYLPSTVELNTNKVTSVSSSSTDTEYPSAKCVYDAISGITPGGGAGYDCYYGYCSSSATTPKKVVTISNSGYTITDHVRLFVYFANAHTYSSSKPYLSIDDVTYNIRYYDLNIGAEDTTSKINSILYSKRYMEFYFLTMSGSLVAIALPDAIPTLFSPYRTNNTRITNLNSLSTADGAYVKFVAATSNVTTGKPVINGAQRDAMVLHFNWDNSAAYAAQLAIQDGSSSEQGGIAYRRQNGTTNGWHTNGWRTIADEDNIGTLTDVEHCYTAALTPAGDGTIVFPIDGTKYRVTQITLTNYDLNATAGFGMSRMFIANNGGSGGYMLGAIDYFTLTSTSTDITMSIQAMSGSGMQNSTNLHVQVRYVKI